MSSKVSSLVISKIPADKREQYKRIFDSSRNFSDPIKAAIEELIKVSYMQSESKDRYGDIMQWSLYQSDQFGYRRALTEVLEMLPSEE